MRTTVDIAPDLLRRLRTEALRRGVSVKALLDLALRRGLKPEPAKAARVRPLPRFAMGAPQVGIDLDRALALADALEDVAVRRELDERR